MNDLKLSDIRTNRVLVEWWSAVMANQNFQTIWKMMNDQHPLRNIAIGTPSTADDSNKRLGNIEGYELCLRRLELCASLDDPAEALPEPTFQPFQFNKETK